MQGSVLRDLVLMTQEMERAGFYSQDLELLLAFKKLSAEGTEMQPELEAASNREIAQKLDSVVALV